MNLFSFTSSPPILTELNNGTLNSTNAMPFKDSTSDGTTSFTIARRSFVTSNNSVPLNTQKKWIGGNRDSSEISRRSRVNAIGAGSFNTANQPISFKTNRDVNVTNDALVRVRAGGSNVPKKVTQKYMLSVTPSTPPSAPTITSITPGNALLTVSFTIPTNNGGETIDNYEYSTDNGTSWQECIPPDVISPIIITTLSTDGITSLTNGVTYDVIIRAGNNNGFGLYSNMVSGTPIQSTPTAPTLIYILPGNGEIYIYFTAGSGTIVNYEYVIDDSNNSYTYLFSPPSITTPACITGLTNNISYTIKIRSITATNDKSGWSNSLSVVPINQSVPAEWLLYDPNNTSSYSGSGTSVSNIGNYGTMTGTKQNSVIWQDGLGSIGRKVFNFSGTDYSTYISFGSIDFGSNFTISSWVYPSSKFSINGILSNVGPNVGTAGFKIGWNNWQSIDKVMLFENGGLGGASNWSVPETVTNVVTFGEWQYLTYAFDKENKRVIFYRNGIPASVLSINTSTNVITSNPFYIGAYYGGSYTMNAQLGLLKVFDSTLNAGQVLTDFNNTKGAFGL